MKDNDINVRRIVKAAVFHETSARFHVEYVKEFARSVAAVYLRFLEERSIPKELEQQQVTSIICQSKGSHL